jgi:SNF2 family DNA or RNA helicase
MTIPFQVEDKVRCRNQIWEVLKITDHEDGSWTVRLYSENEGKPKSFLYPHTPIEPIGTTIDNLENGRIDHIDNYRLLTNATRLSLVYEYDKLLSISNSKMVPEPYQLLAVKKVMESLRQRFLIADDVGLGKTIEAGLIMQELIARQRGARILIVVPASLQDQWKKEMFKHFHRIFFIYNSRKMEGIKELIDENLNPWLAKNSIITSIDWIKPQYEGSGASRRNINKIFDQLTSVEKRWDLIIIDEAHYVSTNANRADFAKAIQDRCDSLLLLTATPHSGNPEHFFNILNLLDPFMFATPEDLDRKDARERVDKIMIRRGKETIFEINSKGDLVKKFKDRKPHPIEIDFSPEEIRLYEAVSNYTAEGWTKLTRRRKITQTERNIGKFLLTLVQKRMVSSIAALRETLSRRIDSIVEDRAVNKIEGVGIKEIKKLLKDYQRNQYMEDEDKELVERYIESHRIQSMYAERTTEIKTLRSFLRKAENLINSGKDSKLSWLIEFLKQLFARDPKEKVIIFTEYRDTLNYVKEQLEKKWFLGSDSVVLIHGGMPLGENEDEVGSKLYSEKRFNEPDTRILLATDGNALKYHLGYRFKTDVLILHFQGVSEPSDEFYTSMKAAIIEAANTVVGSEGGEIRGFSQTVIKDGQNHCDLILYDSVPGGAGYVKKTAVQIDAVINSARALLDGCQCERSCYKCLRSYENQFEHTLLDKSLIQPYLDELVAMNSEEEKARLTIFGEGSRRYCGKNPSSWLQRKCRETGESLLVICSDIFDDDIVHAMSWGSFLIEYAKDHPKVHLALGITRFPNYRDLSEKNFFAMKTLVDLLSSGVKLFHISEPINYRWNIAIGDAKSAILAAATLDTLPTLSSSLETQSIVYNTEANIAQTAFDNIIEIIKNGKAITLDYLKAPQKDAYKIVNVQDGDKGLTYKHLFGAYVTSAEWLKIVDPYIRMPYQVQNLEDFLELISEGGRCNVELVTMYEKNDRYGINREAKSRDFLNSLKERIANKGINFTYSFDSNIHDRIIETESTQIILGRGLDIYYPPDPGMPNDQQFRRTRKCRIIFLTK